MNKTNERSSQSAKDVGATARRSKIEHTNRVKAVPTKKKRKGNWWQQLKQFVQRKPPTVDESDTVEKRFLVDNDDINPVAGKKKKKKDTEVEENFYDIVDMDEGHAQEYITDTFITRFLNSSGFQTFMMAVIFVNAIELALRTSDELNMEYEELFDVIDELILGVYAAEILIKWYCSFSMFWRSGWNIFDFFIVVIMLAGVEFHHLSCLKILRVLPLLHHLRGIPGLSLFKGIDILVASVLKSIPDMMNIAVLLFIVLVILSVAAVNILALELPEIYGSFGEALFHFFSHLTLDGFVKFYDEFAGTDTIYKAVGAVLILIDVVVGTFIFINLIVAVAANTLEEMTEEKTAVDEEKKRQEELELQEMTADDLAADINQNVALTPFEKFHRNVNLLKFQKPMQLLDFKGLSVDKLEKYFLLLAALDENLAEYKDIKSDLDQIYEIVKGVNVMDALDEATSESAHSPRTSAQRPSALRFSRQKRSTLMASPAGRS